MNKSIKTYAEMQTFDTYEERLQYLHIGDSVGRETFGHARQLNQMLYTCSEWRRVRRDVIIRDNGCDLGIDGCELSKGIVHHLNPITVDDIINRDPKVFDLNNLVYCSLNSHNFIHFGLDDKKEPVVERRPNDTCPWKKGGVSK